MKTNESESSLEQWVYKHLRALNVVCTFEHPGWINVPALEARHSWAIGTTNANWSCDYNTDAGCNVFSIELDIRSDSTAIQPVAEAIAKIVREPAELHQLRGKVSELLQAARAVLMYSDDPDSERRDYRTVLDVLRAAFINAGGAL